MMEPREEAKMRRKKAMKKIFIFGLVLLLSLSEEKKKKKKIKGKDQGFNPK